MKRFRHSIVALVAIVLLGLNTGTASALVSKTGSGSCPSGQRVKIIAYGSGWLAIYVPNTSYQAKATSIIFSDNFQQITYTANTRSTKWVVTASGGYLSDPGTHSICVA